MAFYTPAWLRKYIKEEAKNIGAYIAKSQRNDFRSFIDARLPMVLFLDIAEIKEKVLAPNMSMLKAYIEKAFPLKPSSSEDSSSEGFTPAQQEWAFKTLESVLLDAYKKTINDYIANPRFQEVSYEELAKILNGLNDQDVGSLRGYLDSNFSKTMRVGGSLSIKNTRVMLLAPNFTAIKFGTLFRENIDYTPFEKYNSSWYTDDKGEYVQNPYPKISEILEDVTGIVTGKKQSFFTQLQNVGHVEVDVVSQETREVKRGQVSPRFLQALVSVPNEPGVINKLQATFSKETLQFTTRVLVRKKFSSSKMVFELLVENGIPVGIPESQVTNLMKATKEGAFGPGSGLTALIRKNKDFLVDLQTSKSYKKFIEDSLVSLLSTGKAAGAYASDTSFTEKASITRQKVALGPASTRKKSPKQVNSALTKAPKGRKAEGKSTSLAGLQQILDTSLAEKIRQNMGTGASTNILNYRTGRLAESAKVERLSQGRSGMITAYYTYMKYPYATFSEGGVQQYPKTRDPKLLITKSIKELMSAKVAARMRAVLV